jgi:transcriptional regulator with XRE-family HTH domain
MGNCSYERYAKIRDLRGFTDYKVTKLAGIKGTATISNWKNGKYVPKDDKMQRIADVLNVSLDFLVGKTDMLVCPICGFGDNPLSEQSRKEHELFHQQFLMIKEKYPFFMTFNEASIERTDRISEFRNPQKTINGKIEAFEKYLEAAFSLKIHQNNFNIESLDYKSFCQTEVCDLEPDYEISQEVIDALIEKYEVDKNFSNRNERLLARVSNNPQIMALLAYAEKLSPEMLSMLEVQAKALSEQNAKDQE